MLDYYLLAKELTQMLSDNASRYIAWATGSKRNNNGQRSGWDRCPTEVVAWQRRPESYRAFDDVPIFLLHSAPLEAVS